MISASHYFKIINCVVLLVAVTVVNNLIWQ